MLIFDFEFVYCYEFGVGEFDEYGWCMMLLCDVSYVIVYVLIDFSLDVEFVVVVVNGCFEICEDYCCEVICILWNCEWFMVIDEIV